MKLPLLDGFTGCVTRDEKRKTTEDRRRETGRKQSLTPVQSSLLTGQAPSEMAFKFHPSAIGPTYGASRGHGEPREKRLFTHFCSKS